MNFENSMTSIFIKSEKEVAEHLAETLANTYINKPTFPKMPNALIVKTCDFGTKHIEHIEFLVENVKYFTITNKSLPELIVSVVTKKIIWSKRIFFALQKLSA